VGKLEIKFSSGLAAAKHSYKSIPASGILSLLPTPHKEPVAQPDTWSLNLLAWLCAPSFIPTADTSRKALFGLLHVVVNIYKTGLDLSSGIRNFFVHCKKDKSSITVLTETNWSLYPTRAQPRVRIIFLVRDLPLGPRHIHFPCRLGLPQGFVLLQGHASNNSL